MEDTCDELSATIFVNCRLVKVSFSFELYESSAEHGAFRSQNSCTFVQSSYIVL